jgi:hypothetical protein
MPLTPLRTVVETYIANIAWEAEQDLTKAKAFLAAAEEIAIRRPTRGDIDGHQIVFDYVHVRDNIRRARAYVNANAGSGTSSGTLRAYDMSNIRGE